MPVNNQDKGIPNSPAIGIRPTYNKVEEQVEEKVGIFTDNFRLEAPVNPILWGPRQDWAGIDGYTEPAAWRNKELLRIPRVVRFIYAVSDACDHTDDSTLPEGDLIWTDMNDADGYWELTVSTLTLDGTGYTDVIIRFCLDVIYFDPTPGVINMLYSGAFPPTLTPDPGVNGHLNVYGDDGMGNPKATVDLNGVTYGDEV